MTNQKENLHNDKKLFKMICNNSEPIIKSALKQIKQLHSASKFFSSHMQNLVWVSIGDVTALAAILAALESNTPSFGIGLGCAAISTSLLAATISTFKVDNILDKMVNEKFLAKLENIREKPQVELFLSYLKHKEDENNLEQEYVTLLQMTNNPLETYSKLTCELNILSSINQDTLTKSGKKWLRNRYVDSYCKFRDNLNILSKIGPSDLKLLVQMYNDKHSLGVGFKDVSDGKILCRDICGTFNYDKLRREAASTIQNDFSKNIQIAKNEPKPKKKSYHFSHGVDENGQPYIDIDIDQDEIDKIFEKKEEFYKNLNGKDGERDF